MGIEAKFTVSITKTCDGCGDCYEATGEFSSASAAIAFGGPVEAAHWEYYVEPKGVSLLCDLCAVYNKAGL